MLPILIAEWLHLACTEYRNSRESMIIMFWKYFVDISSEAWLNLFWEYVNRKLFAVQARSLEFCNVKSFLTGWLIDCFQAFLAKNIMPKLEAALLHIPINPLNQVSSLKGGLVS
jgi:hypothetical protein